MASVADAGLYESVIDASVKSVLEFRLVPRCGPWCHTRSPDLLFKFHGLVDRLPAGESRDKLPAVVRVLGAERGVVGAVAVRISQKYGSITSCQPARKRDRVPSKSNRAWRMRPETIPTWIVDPNGCTDRLRGESSSRTSATVTVQGAARKPA